MCEFRVGAPGIGRESRFENRLVAVFESVGQGMLQGLDGVGVRVGVRRPDGEGAGKFSERFPRPDQRVVAGEQGLLRCGNASDAVFGDDARVCQRRHGGGRNQGDVGFVLGKGLDCFGGVGQQQSGAEIIFVLDTIDEWRRAEARHDGYTWNYDHHP